MEIPGYERKKTDNPFNYTEDQLLEKKVAMKTLKELYPDVPAYYAELAYDLCINTSQEEIDKIKEKVETIPFKYKNKEINNKN